MPYKVPRFFVYLSWVFVGEHFWFDYRLLVRLSNLM